MIDQLIYGNIDGADDTMTTALIAAWRQLREETTGREQYLRSNR